MNQADVDITNLYQTALNQNIPDKSDPTQTDMDQNNPDKTGTAFNWTLLTCSRIILSRLTWTKLITI